MGIISSRNTRRISFDNNFAMNNSALPISNSINDDRILTNFDELAPETTEEIYFADKNTNKSSETHLPDENETDYWTSRIEHLKKEHQVINQIIEKQFNKEYEDINKTYEPPTITHEKVLRVKPCFDWRSKIVQCYEDNPHQPLVCSPVVQAFSKCVASCRAQD